MAESVALRSPSRAVLPEQWGRPGPRGGRSGPAEEQCQPTGASRQRGAGRGRRTTAGCRSGVGRGSAGRGGSAADTVSRNEGNRAVGWEGRRQQGDQSGPGKQRTLPAHDFDAGAVAVLHPGMSRPPVPRRERVPAENGLPHRPRRRASRRRSGALGSHPQESQRAEQDQDPQARRHRTGEYTHLDHAAPHWSSRYAQSGHLLRLRCWSSGDVALLAGGLLAVRAGHRAASVLGGTRLRRR